MGKWTERRSLYYEDDEKYDPYMSLDVNEYLISEWPTLSLKQRRAVWTLAQADEEFDWSSIEDQIDYYVEEVMSSEDGEDDEELDDDLEYLYEALAEYVQEYWDDVGDELDDLVEFVIVRIDEAVDEYYNDEEDTDEDTTEETEETE